MKEIMERLDKLNPIHFPSIWCELNARKWPTMLGSKPEGYGEDAELTSEIFRAVNNYVLQIVGKKAIDRQWRKSQFVPKWFRLNSKTLFDDFWSSKTLEQIENRFEETKELGERTCALVQKLIILLGAGVLLNLIVLLIALKDSFS